jgi:two-component system cell cycle sensor histidine kinase/response regulator CckA
MHIPSATQPGQVGGRRSAGRALHRPWRVIGCATAALTIAAGCLYAFATTRYEQHQKEATAAWRERLMARADDRAAAVERWVGEALEDARVLAALPVARAASAGERGGRSPTVGEDPTSAMHRELAAVVEGSDYRTAYLVTQAGLTAWPGASGAPPVPEVLALARRAMDERRALAGSFGRGAGASTIVLCAPIVPAVGSRVALAAVVLEADPAPWLFALLRREIVRTETAETVLVGLRDGGSVLLSPSRVGNGAAVQRRGLSPLLVAEAMKAPRGVFREYTDRAGVPVLAFARSVPGTEWVVVAKVDRAEALRGAGRRTMNESLLLLACLTAVVGAGWGAWSRREARHRAAIARSEARFALLRDRANDAILFISADGRIVEANRRAEEMYALSRAELLERSIGDLLAGATRDELAHHMERCVTENGHMFESEHLTSGGARVPVEMSCRPAKIDGEMLYVSVVRDISERKEAEEALRREKERYREFFEEDLTADFVATADGQILTCNPAFAKIFGFSSVEEARAVDITALYPAPGARARFLELLRKERRLAYFEQELRRKDGTPVHVVQNAVGVFDEHGRLTHTRGYLFDITAHKLVEDQLRHAQKMEALGRLAGGVAHDFNNLLQAMLATVQLLALRGADTEAGSGVVGELEQHVRRGAALARQLLLFARRAVVHPEKLDLNAVVSDAGVMLERLVRENIRVEVRLADRPLLIDGDRGQLEQVLSNLVVNAVDAMPDGGVLTIRTGSDDAGNGWVEVEDTGTGIPAETLGKIFEPFFTTKPAGRGTGLGLPVVHGIVIRHGGRVDVESAPGRGSRFRVVFPRHASGVFPMVAGGEPGKATAAIVGGNERILLVEDNEQVRTVLGQALAELGYAVTAAASGEEAGRLPAEPAFDLLISDVMLPGATGIAVAMGLRARWPLLKVILMSGYAENELQRKDLDEGRFCFLQKPVDFATLARQVRSALDA